MDFGVDRKQHNLGMSIALSLLSIVYVSLDFARDSFSRDPEPVEGYSPIYRSNLTTFSHQALLSHLRISRHNRRAVFVFRWSGAVLKNFAALR